LGSSIFESSIQFFTRGNLTGLQKCFDEFAFATNDHAGEF
jgi:hypothetical protein